MKKYLSYLSQYFDNTAAAKSSFAQNPRQINWIRIIPFILLHIGALLVFFIPFSWFAVFICLFIYTLKMIGITAFYHRYFSHKAFKTNRFWQFIFALIGATAIQRGPLWWASHHRHHHRYSDTHNDKHSPRQKGFLWSHYGWFLANENFSTNYQYVKDLVKYPELCFLDRHDILIPILLAISLYSLGHYLSIAMPMLHTSGLQLLAWGFFLSSILCYQATFAINSLTHLFGKKRYTTKDTSGNHFLLALITFGEGWHNNHHFYPASAKQGFYWWEIDMSYYFLKMLSCFGIIHNLKLIPNELRAQHK